MNSSEQFKNYTEKVCEQIRWKNAHNMVKKEIENHLIDQKIAYMNMGDSESIAEEKALLQMGDPVAVGAALDETHKPAPQKCMIGLVSVLFFLGFIIQYRLTLGSVLEVKSGSIPYQFAMFGFAWLIFIGAYFLDFSVIRKHPYLLFVLLFSMDLWMQFFGTTTYGQNWFIFGPFSMSSASLSLLFPLAFCGIFYKFREKGKNGYFRSGVIAALFCSLLLTSHTVGGLFVFVCSAGILMAVAAWKKWFGDKTKSVLLFFILAGILGIGMVLIAEPYRLERLTYILHPDADPTGSGYIPTLLRGMLKNAVFFGEGDPFIPNSAFLDKGILFQPDDAALYLPYFSVRTDYLLAYLTYEYGWIVFITLVGLLAVFLVFGFRKCLKQKSVLGQIVSLSILCTFSTETLLYIIANLGVTYFAPIALPFLSYGGTALVIHMALAGMLLSTFRTGEVYIDSIEPKLNDNKFIQWDNGKLIISFK